LSNQFQNNGGERFANFEQQPHEYFTIAIDMLCGVQ